MGHNLPLKTRRALANGISPRVARAWGSRKFLSLASGRRAYAVLGTGNSAFRVRAVQPGTAGNSVTLAIVNGGTAPVVTYVGSAVTVTTPVASTTANQVCDAINRSSTVDAAGRTIDLLWAMTASGSDGTGLVSAVAATPLSNGTAPG